MPTYTVHIRADAVPGDAAAFAEAALVKDGFSLGAFVFTALWFLWHRLWLALLGVLALYAVFHVLASALGVHPLAVALGQALIGLGLALEARSLQRWTLARRGFPVRDLVIADNAEDAEAKAAARWIAGASAIPPVPPSTSPPRAAPGRSFAQASALPASASSAPSIPSASAADPAILGLFPTPGGGR